MTCALPDSRLALDVPAQGIVSSDLLGRGVLVACEYKPERCAMPSRLADGMPRAATCCRVKSRASTTKATCATFLAGLPTAGDAPVIPWDILIAHPPCTHLAVSGARWWASKPPSLQADALDFGRLLLAAPVPHIALENPVSAISSRVRRPDQVIQPWQFGHGEVKATCLWLKNLPKLTPTRIVEGREARVHRMPPGPDRWKERSRTLPGIAQAFADQWTRATRPNTLLGHSTGDKKP